MQIAAALGISEHTVKFHVSSIYTKLNVTNRTESVREGLRGGWVVLQVFKTKEHEVGIYQCSNQNIAN